METEHSTKPVCFLSLEIEISPHTLVSVFASEVEVAPDFLITLL
jgi:hypothetical protein